MSEVTEEVTELSSTEESLETPPPDVQPEEVGQPEETSACACETLSDAQRNAVLEALIFAHGEPIDSERLMEVLGWAREDLDRSLHELTEKYATDSSGIELVKVAGKYQYRTKASLARYVCLLKEQKPRKLSAAALETLSVIAYRQPVTRYEIEKIRGVDPSPTLKTLLEKDLVTIVGHKESVGQPGLYGTTEKFLQIFGLASLAELPALRELKQIENDPGEQRAETEEAEESDFAEAFAAEEPAEFAQELEAEPLQDQ